MSKTHWACGIWSVRCNVYPAAGPPQVTRLIARRIATGDIVIEYYLNPDGNIKSGLLRNPT